MVNSEDKKNKVQKTIKVINVFDFGVYWGISYFNLNPKFSKQSGEHGGFEFIY